ncbi:protein Shroom3 [Acetobacter orientalis]|uniref:Protein Shroom3 n=1 Tax=Acetobacter orientalis TaxID=146474 RepID=A0A2Z5ZKH3_9PROT|nr:protein Shroom3 [Acetobacter orientalis]
MPTWVADFFTDRNLNHQQKLQKQDSHSHMSDNVFRDKGGKNDIQRKIRKNYILHSK